MLLRSSLLTTAFAVVVAQKNMNDWPTCPCGLSGTNCNIPLKPLPVMNATCVNEGYQSLCTDNSTHFMCVCMCGFEGHLCERKVAVAETPAYVFASFFVVLFLMTVATAFFQHRRNKQTNSADLVMDCQRSYVPYRTSVSPMALTALRLTVALFYTGMQIWQYDVYGWGELMRMYTLWNFHLIIVYMYWGAIIGLMAWRDPESQKGPAKWYHKAHFVMFVIELPVSLIVCLVTWGFIYPLAKSANQEWALENFGSYNQHFMNMVWMLTDASLNGYMIKSWDVLWCFKWAIAYATFHGLYMLIRASMNLAHCPSYPFLHMQDIGVVIWLFGLLLLHYLFFTCGKHINNRCCRKLGKIDLDQKYNDPVVEAAPGGAKVAPTEVDNTAA